MTGQQQEGRWEKRPTNDFVQINDEMVPYFCIVQKSDLGEHYWSVVVEKVFEQTADQIIRDHGQADVAEALRDDLRLIMDQRDVTMEVNQVLIAENARLRESMKYLARLGDDHVKQYVEDALDAAPENKQG